MIEVTLDGYKYRYCRNERGRYWIGLNGYHGALNPIQNCVAPRCVWGRLQEIAIAEGVSVTEFFSKKEEKPASKRSSKKSSKPSISIF